MKNILVLFLLVSLSGNLLADSFRCGRKLVQTGDSTGDLVRTCGEPRHKDRGQEKVRIDGIFRKAGVERWHYKKSARSLEHIIVIYKGRVASVEVGER